MLEPDNLAEVYARRWNLPVQAEGEEGWVFRLRVARELERLGHAVEAHEVLYNTRQRNWFFALALDNGYGDVFVSERAQATEAGWQAQCQQHARAAPRRWWWWIGKWW
jgi:hypothetical protein